MTFEELWEEFTKKLLPSEYSDTEKILAFLFYKKGKEQAEQATLERVAKYIEDQGIVETSGGTPVYYVNYKDVEHIRKGGIL